MCIRDRFTIADSPVKEEKIKETADNTETVVEKTLEKSEKKERKLLTIRTPGGKKDDSSF